MRRNKRASDQRISGLRFGLSSSLALIASGGEIGRAFFRCRNRLRFGAFEGAKPQAVSRDCETQARLQQFLDGEVAGAAEGEGVVADAGGEGERRAADFD